MPVAYNYEYPNKLRSGFIGCGGHAFRNIYPTFQYAPVNLVAVCDLNPAKAEACAKIFGADRYYSNHAEMLQREELDLVFIVTNVDETHSVLRLLAGPIEWIFVNRNDIVGSATVSIRFRSGAVGTLHLSAGQSGTSFLERLEVVGQGENLVVENNIRLIHSYCSPGLYSAA